MSCEGACHSVPSPLVGEGQGEGWQRALSARLISFIESRTMAIPHLSLSGDMRQGSVRVLPLSLSLPHKGGGNDVELLCPTADTTREYSCRCACLSASAGTNGSKRRFKLTHLALAVCLLEQAGQQVVIVNPDAVGHEDNAHLILRIEPHLGPGTVIVPIMPPDSLAIDGLPDPT